MIAEIPSRIVMELQNLPEVEYPEEVIRELDMEVEATKALFAAGEIEPLTAAEFAERVGIRRDADSGYIDGPDSRYIDPADYPDTTAYLNALPGVAERLIAYRDLPDSEFKPVPRKFVDV